MTIPTETHSPRLANCVVEQDCAYWEVRVHLGFWIWRIRRLSRLVMEAIPNQPRINQANFKNNPPSTKNKTKSNKKVIQSTKTNQRRQKTINQKINTQPNINNNFHQHSTFIINSSKYMDHLPKRFPFFGLVSF